ncbi:uncharacterized protein BJ212DRAFT_1333069 [Suillus subaureus]|uniref:F-box domain-containing protein n=1 Tax=Suillus subaureus TaxID=48587 RepID=A0A9P7EI03_9AGAM|nr:uncharacterized protein BJ212DRAFT_1333069 [Suillus subaureus]KAG1821728.1 hypothetical protein BJ212DRAFT_1333069 [Suillus subaureus]
MERLFRDPYPSSQTPLTHTIISALPTSAPRLKALEIKGRVIFMTDKNPSRIESLLISYSDGLTELSLTSHLHDVSSTTLNIIAPWPSLRSLTLKLGLKGIPITPLRIPQPFATLIHLHISSDDSLDLFISFLRTFRILKFDSSNIVSLNLKTIQFNAGHCVPANIWSQSLTSLIHANTKLEHVILTEKCEYCYWRCECLPSSSFDFRPLLAHQGLAGLSTLVLSPGPATSIILTDADISALARTCPHFQILDLGSRNTPVSLYALNILVRRCRELREVSLYLNVTVRVDALTDNTNADDDEVGLQPNPRFIKLEVCPSPIEIEYPVHPLGESLPELTWTEESISVSRVMHHGMGGHLWQEVSDALGVMVTDEGGAVAESSRVTFAV